MSKNLSIHTCWVSIQQENLLDCCREEWDNFTEDCLNVLPCSSTTVYHNGKPRSLKWIRHNYVQVRIRSDLLILGDNWDIVLEQEVEVTLKNFIKMVIVREHQQRVSRFSEASLNAEYQFLISYKENLIHQTSLPGRPTIPCLIKFSQSFKLTCSSWDTAGPVTPAEALLGLGWDAALDPGLDDGREAALDVGRDILLSCFYFSFS